ncbi:DUF3325 family protein [Pseudohongiella nitratireducens]|uniref:DUF3325 family protein n=1 Tax=Pseudohongiella nitratireducens TaxID=1768907 RepID=UPI0030EE6D47|tara:strand:+ start:1963 stop:2301 length:339 start_codon:yes stop_codon:yes gene_type:complete
MNSQLLTLAYSLLLAAAFAAICMQSLRFQRQQQQNWLPVKLLKLSAWPLLLCLAILAIGKLGWGFGLVTLFAAASLAAVTVVATFTYKPGKLPLLYSLSLPTGSIFLALGLL